MKKLLLILVSSAVHLVCHGQATNLPASFSPAALVYTNGFSDNTTNTTASGPLNVTKNKRLAFCIKYQLSGSGSATNYYDFEASLDNTNWPGVYQTISLPANGTNFVMTNFGLDVTDVGYLRLSRTRHGNNSGSYTTNQAIYYTPKPFPRD